MNSRWRLGARPGLAGRLLTLALLLLALWNPRLPGGEQPLSLTLLLDDSASMPRSLSDETWRQVMSELAADHRPTRVDLVRFGGDRVREFTALDPARDRRWATQPPRLRPLERGESDIGQALRSALVRMESGRPRAILLVSDGLPTRDGLPAALNAVERSGVPLFWLRPAAPPVAGDLRIAGLRTPERILYGQPLHLTVELDSNGPANGQLSVSVDGRRLLQRPVTLAGGRPEQIPLRLGGLDSGTHRLRVTVDQADDPRPANNSRQATIQVDGPARVLYLDRGGPLPPLAASLRAGGWPLTHRTTEDFEPALLQRHDVLVLDDIAVSDLEEETWRGIGEAVRARGKGLLVLGGPHAFGGGGYRHSRLEALLPVTAEANQPLDPAAVLFLLDKSGSMEQREGVSGPSRLAVARQAIRETAALLEPGDLSGLITFDREAEQRLPLAPRKQPAAAIDRAGSFTPHGGTRLAPALRMAVEELAASAPKQRIILLVSDGFVEESGAFDAIAGDMARAGIDLIALAIGPTPDEGVLRRLTRINRGRLIRLQGILRLPRLMQQALQRHRAAIREGPLKPRLLHRPGFMALPDDWPPLQAGMVTRARPGAETWLVSQQGDPLLAGWFAGSGRVLTLPAGLGDWATAWQRWPAWGELAGGLIEEAAATRRDPMISIQRS
ncbi:MAG TPA: VWA domain-containing protein, partial [Sedimenticola sp.]|nr:VWA domain-containing protein [Sedimenticola sp.]